MITIIIPEWVMWLIVAFLFVNAAVVGFDMLVRMKIYKILLPKKHE